MTSANWVPVPRDFTSEKHLLPSSFVSDHPLNPDKKETPQIKEEKKGTPISNPLASSDPLGAFNDPLGAASDPLSDPLSSAFKNESFSQSMAAQEAESEMNMETFTPWAAKKSGILHKYTTSGRLNITTSFLSSKEMPKVDKAKARLESLEEDDEDSTQTQLNVSQQDYVKLIDDLHSQLITAWDADQRVKALKIAIQGVKFLADTKVPQFYPSKFVLITEILDTFGRLVFDRIFLKSTYTEPGSTTPIPLKENFTPDQVSESAKETCKNWFFKIASIRELLPRLFVEMSILKCYKFLAVDEYSTALNRLSHMTRGIGDPLVATYARAYLCRKGMEVAPNRREHLFTLFYDFAFAYHQLDEKNVTTLMEENNMSYEKYLDLYIPALDWILQCIAHRADDKDLEVILNKYTQYCKNALVLDCIISSFSPDYVSMHALKFSELIKDADCHAYPQYQLYQTLGVNLVLSSPSKDILIPLLKIVWPIITQLEDPAQCMKCAEIYIEIPSKHMTTKEVDMFLGEIIQRITPNRAFENLLTQLQSVVEKILTHQTNFTQIFSMTNFVPLLDMFQSQPSIKVEVCKSIMTYFMRTPEENTQDVILINGLLYVAKTLHDSISALTFDDEKRQISELILGFIKRIHYGRDFEEQLNFYVTCRSYFNNLDTVLQSLVQSTCYLVMQVHLIIKGAHNRKTAAFVHAAIGFCFITIPAILNTAARLSLYLLSAQVAIINGCLPQADSILEAAISLVSEFSSYLELDQNLSQKAPFLVEQAILPILLKFCSTLILIPGHPEKGPFYLLKDFLNALQNFPWAEGGDGKAIIYLGIIDLVSCMRQNELPYVIDNVEPNSVLYDGDDRYFAELDSIANTVLQEVITFINDQPNLQKKSELSLQLFYRYLTIGGVENKETLILLTTLYTTAKKNLSSSPLFKSATTLLAQKARTSNPYLALQREVEK